MSRRLSPTKREALWLCEATAAVAADRGPHPICNLCDLPVQPGQAWDESHMPIARSFGGSLTGVAHERCNRMHGVQVVWPAVAKSNRVRRFHIGASGPGLGRYPMRAGRRSLVSKTFRNGLQPRLTLAQKHARAMAARAIVPLEVSAPSIAPEV